MLFLPDKVFNLWPAKILEKRDSRSIVGPVRIYYCSSILDILEMIKFSFTTTTTNQAAITEEYKHKPGFH